MTAENTYRIESGSISVTPGALAAFERVGMQHITDYLHRHQWGDWGDVDAEDREENIQSVMHGYRVLSAYTLTDDTKIWIITEADRSSTTLLLPDEY